MSPRQSQKATGSAYLLPRAAYVSEAWFAHEQAELFQKDWYFAGFANDVRQPGDYRCVDVGATGVFVIRDGQGALRAFRNMCRHRGAALLEGQGSVKNVISCFYHAWTYGLDGSLRGVSEPDQFPSLNKAEHGLLPLAVENFRGMIFVHLDASQQGRLMDWLGDFPQHFGPFDTELLTPVDASRREMNANWKLFVENHIDGLHLHHLHRHSMQGIDHSRQENFLYRDHWSIYEPVLKAGVLPDYERAIPGRLLSDQPKWHGSSVHMLFPNLGVATGAKWFTTIQAIPVSPTRTVLETRVFIDPDLQQKADALVYFEPISVAPDQSIDLIGEDVMACERIQKAMLSPHFAVGPLARDYESSISAFHKSILARVGDAPA